MTPLEGFVIAVLGAMLVVALLVYFMDFKQVPVKAIKRDITWGDFESDKKWNELAEKSKHDALERVRKTAAAWAGSVATLLGLTATLTVIKGPGAFSDLTAGAANLAFALLVVAGLFAGAATLLAALASQGVPQRLGSLDGATLKHVTEGRVKDAIGQLAVSRLTAITAAVLIFAAVVVTWNDGRATTDDPSPAFSIVTDGEGALHCGKVTTSPGGRLALEVTDGPPPAALKKVVSSVAKCPGAATE